MVTWINLDGIQDIGVIEKIGRHFGIHPLTLEDIIDTDQRPKMEDFDNYFRLPERLSLSTEFLHEEALRDPTPKTLEAIQTLRRQMISLRKSIWPLREVVSRLERGESYLIEEPTRLYLRDVYDHTIQVVDTIETTRDSLSGMLEVYLSSISNRMNQVMKVLTIVATIFIPLTFIAGIYGMNFRNIPELEWRWGYPLVLLAMVGVVVSMLVYFKRKRWL